MRDGVGVERETTQTGVLMTRDYRIENVSDNGEFLTFATLVLLEDGVEIRREDHIGNSEFPPGDSATRLASSSGEVWVESSIPMEVRLAPWGLEWERERMEDRLGHFVPLSAVDLDNPIFDANDLAF